jgi:hypothetical protein
MHLSRNRDYGMPQNTAVLVSDPAEDEVTILSLESLLGQERRLQAALLLPHRPRPEPGETPIMGEGAVSRWVALHDRARAMRAGLRPGDSVGERQVRRAIRSLFLYEHVMTPKTRWQARTRLWERDRTCPLPSFVEQLCWAQCWCWRCQPAAPHPQPLEGRSRFVGHSA